MSTLKQVLAAFEQTEHPFSLPQLAKQLGVSEPILEDMIHFWVRKGKLREVINDCPSCSKSKNCQFVVQLPRRYELASDGDGVSCHCSQG